MDREEEKRGSLSMQIPISGHEKERERERNCGVCGGAIYVRGHIVQTWEQALVWPFLTSNARSVLDGHV